MEQTTNDLTIEFIKEHPEIKRCLKKELINYSSLARLIAKELKIERKSSKEAILIAARRFKQSLKWEETNDEKISDLLEKSEVEIKNKISVFILEKGLNFEVVDEIQRQIRKESGAFYLIEGSDNYTLVIQDKYASLIKQKFSSRMIKQRTKLALINIITPKEIENTPGFISYTAGLFSEHGVNIVEFISCWTDNLFIINADDVKKTLEFLEF